MTLIKQKIMLNKSRTTLIKQKITLTKYKTTLTKQKITSTKSKTTLIKQKIAADVSVVVLDLDATSLRADDPGADSDVELTTRRRLDPDMVALGGNYEYDNSNPEMELIYNNNPE